MRIQDPYAEYYVHGFLQALRRFRSTVVSGWAIAGTGLLIVFLRWRMLTPFDVLLCVLTVFAGLLVVSHALKGLEVYVRIRFPEPSAEMSFPLDEIRSIMKDVDEGGWHDAFRALGRLRQISGDLDNQTA